MKLATRINGVNIYVSDSCVFPAQIAAALGLDVESYIGANRYPELCGIEYDENVFFIDLFDTLGDPRRVALIPIDKAIYWISYLGAIMNSFYGNNIDLCFSVKPESTLDKDCFSEYIDAISLAIEPHSSLTKDQLDTIDDYTKLEEVSK